MTVALIIAGGTGSRMGQEIPKQFLNVYDKPVLIYTLETFQSCPDIDEIFVVCLEGWEEMLKAYCRQFGIAKLAGIVRGGKSGQESIRNGIDGIAESHAGGDIVVIHDGVRPLVERSVLSDVIATAVKFGNGVSSLPYNEQMFVRGEDGATSGEYIPREKLQRVVTPQAYKLGDLVRCYERAFRERIGIGPSSYTNTMMADLGETLHFAAGSEKNIKLTTRENLEIFKAYLSMEKGGWLK